MGHLFKHRERAKDRKELMLFVTPPVHETPETITWDKMLNLSVATKTPTDWVPALAPRRETRKD